MSVKSKKVVDLGTLQRKLAEAREFEVGVVAHAAAYNGNVVNAKAATQQALAALEDAARRVVQGSI
jgi:hypothetical protein